MDKCAVVCERLLPDLGVGADGLCVDDQGSGGRLLLQCSDGQPLQGLEKMQGGDSTDSAEMMYANSQHACGGDSSDSTKMKNAISKHSRGGDSTDRGNPQEAITRGGDSTDSTKMMNANSKLILKHLLREVTCTDE